VVHLHPAVDATTSIMGEHPSSPVSGAGAADRESAERAPGEASARRYTGNPDGARCHRPRSPRHRRGGRRRSGHHTRWAAPAPQQVYEQLAAPTRISRQFRAHPGAGADVLDWRICRLDDRWPSSVHHL